MSPESPLRVLIAEDDPAQLETLSRLVLRLRPGWQIVATARDGDEVLAAIDQHLPDLLLLDIHLRQQEGGAWLERLPHDIPLVFCTGDPEFAIQAFDRGAADYILKPVTPRRLKTALERFESRLAPARHVPAPVPAEPESDPQDWIALSRGSSLIVVPHAEIVFAQAELRYTRIASRRGDGLARMGIGELVERLKSPHFVRIHRGVLVNINCVASITRTELGHMEVRLHGREEVFRISKGYQAAFKAL